MNFFKKEKKEPENIKEVLESLKALEEKVQKMAEEISALKEKNKSAVQKFSITRFNPFREVGSDQSFSMALLDDFDNGAVITSHYSRKENRVYGKPIKNGKSDYTLSEEEIKAIDIAKNKNPEEFLKTNGKNIKGNGR
jgi:hypothetical protein